MRKIFCDKCDAEIKGLNTIYIGTAIMAMGGKEGVIAIIDLCDGCTERLRIYVKEKLPKAVLEKKHYYNAYEEGDTLLLEMGSHQELIIDKCFGPMIFANLRVRPLINNGDAFWLIERLHIDKDDNSKQEWREQIRIPAQLPGEFDSE